MTSEVYTDILPAVGDVTRDVDLAKYEFIPWRGRFLVERFAPDKVSRGGVEIPSSAQKPKTWGRVVKLPPEGLPGVELGMIVLFLDGAGENVEPLGENYVLLDHRDDFESDVLGVFRLREGEVDKTAAESQE